MSAALPVTVRVQLVCSPEGDGVSSVRLELAVIIEKACLTLTFGEDGFVSAALTVQEVATPLGSAGACSTSAGAAVEEAGEADAAASACEGEPPQGTAELALRQRHAELLQENERLQALVRQHLDGISKASRKSLQEAGSSAPGDVVEQQQRYILALQQLRRLVAQKGSTAAAAAAALVPEHARLAAATEAARAQRAALLQFVSDVAMAASRAAAAGQRHAALPDRVLQHFLEVEPAKAAEGRALRATSARLAHRLAASERRLKEADQVSAEGLHLVDFEQTRIENAQLAAKREARGAEVEKLRGRLVQTVQITAHVREKLHCAKLEREALAAELEAAEAALVTARTEQVAAKADRERLQRERGELAQDWCIVSDKRCLEDMRGQRARLDELTRQAEELRARYEAGERAARLHSAAR